MEWDSFLFFKWFLNFFLELTVENIIPHIEWAEYGAEKMQEAFL